jgi:uncharacterized membrane protein (DUF485 family)
MVHFSKSAWILLAGVGLVWYINLILLIVSCCDYPGSDILRDYTMPIGLVFLVATACFRQTYTMKKREAQPADE